MLVCAVIYLLAAVTARPGMAWLGFLVTGPAVAIGPILDAEWLSLAIIGAFGLVLVVIGLVRGTWKAAGQPPAAARRRRFRRRRASARTSCSRCSPAS